MSGKCRKLAKFNPAKINPISTTVINIQRIIAFSVCEIELENVDHSVCTNN